MPKLRRLSGHEVVGILQQFGFVLVSQRGSHMKLKRVAASETQVLTIPAHAELDTGTLRTILRQASRYLLESELKPHFYTD
jgi:predicted RNA binding protein YcfA (HicA-like mRNA interferase family)